MINKTDFEWVIATISPVKGPDSPLETVEEKNVAMPVSTLSFISLLQASRHSAISNALVPIDCETALT